MVDSSSLKQKLVKPQFIEMLAMMVESCEAVKSKQMEAFRRATFETVESLAKHSKLLNNHH